MGWLFNGIGELLTFIVNVIFVVIEPLFDIIGVLLSTFIYNAIATLFQVFTTVAQTNILDQAQVSGIYQRITMILTIVMTFYITFEFVKYVVSPNNMTDKEKGAGKVVYRMIIAIILIAFVPKIFTIAYDLQSKVISNQVIPTIILGKKSENHKRLGSAFAADTMSLFYRVNEEGCKKNASNCANAQKKIDNQLRQMRENDEMVLFDQSIFGFTTESTDNGVKIFRAIEFDSLLAVIVGGFILYILVLYAIDLGKRYAQLIYLQIIAPIAIIGYISPKKDGIFPKWTKQCLTTYLDVFIRLSIIYLILLIIGVLNESKADLFNIQESTFTVETLSYLAIVMGLLAFAHKAPKMLQELFPNSGGAASIGFGLNSKERFEPTTKAIKGTVGLGLRTAGAVAGTAVGAYAGWKAMAGAGKKAAAWSATKAAYRGLKAGAGKQGNPRKGMQAARDSYQKDIDTREAGGNPWTADLHGGREANTAKNQDRLISKIESMSKYKKTVGTSIENIKFRKQMDKMGEVLVASGNVEAAKAWDGEKKVAEKLTRKYASGMIDEVTYKTEMENIAVNFNTRYNLTGTNAQVSITESDLELDSTAKWSSISTALNEAKNHAIDVAKENIKYTTKDKQGNNVTVEIKYDDSNPNDIKQKVIYTTTDQNGNTSIEEKEYAFNQFAEKIGDLTDVGEAAVVDIKASKEYKVTHANAQASGNGGKK